MSSAIFRRLARALPHSVEQPHFDAPSFRVETKIFAQLSADGRTGLVKLPLMTQQWALATHPDACSPEPQWGRHGWTRLTLALLPEPVQAELLQTSWRAVAPERLHGLLPS